MLDWKALGSRFAAQYVGSGFVDLGFEVLQVGLSNSGLRIWALSWVIRIVWQRLMGKVMGTV